MSTTANSRDIAVRPLARSDVPTFLGLIEALAHYERLTPPDANARRRLTEDATSDPPRFWTLLAEDAGRVVGYAVYFETYSTFLASPTLYLEDIFVLPEARRRGVGQALMRELAREAIRRGCGRMEWQALTWNTPALAFYDSLGARRMDDWCAYRLTADEFEAVAEGKPA
ncbi:MAG: N-acetyltransferase family protein [Sphingomonadaceae bacterium]